MRLYLIRHAQSANNAIYAATGDYAGRSSDPDITDIGHQQAQRLATFLIDPAAEPSKLPRERANQHQFALSHLYCSLMTRTILTGTYVAEACRLPLVALPHTYERGGVYDRMPDGNHRGLPGRARSYFSNRFPQLRLPNSATEGGWYNRAFETDDVFMARVKQAVADIERWHGDSDDRVALIAHGDFIDQFINELMQTPRHEPNYRGPWEGNWVLNNTSITRVDYLERSRSIVYVNRCDHLSAELVTW